MLIHSQSMAHKDLETMQLAAQGGQLARFVGSPTVFVALTAMDVRIVNRYRYIMSFAESNDSNDSASR